MLLIATDEAGYGPKLGPLIITGTAWEVQGHPDRESLDRLFLPLREPQFCGEIPVVVDDSKAVFKPSGGLAGLHAVVSACMHWCKRPEKSFLSALPYMVDEDLPAIRGTPWLEMLCHDEPWVPLSETKEFLASWQSTGLRLVGVQSRVITAKVFNEFCEGGANKADLLSQTTLNLVKRLASEYQGDSEFIDVYCDRHGGRRYYAGVLQHVFSERLAQVQTESAKESSYRLTGSGPDLSVRFTVKGDRFSPVALASMHAKYLREKCMSALNQYFADRCVGELKPTAGYPVDADRFLASISDIIVREKIEGKHLIRAR